MANVFVNLPVPVTPGIGASVSVAGIMPLKNLVVEGPGKAAPAETGANGVLVLEASQDGVNFAPFLTLSLIADPRVPPFTIVCSHMRVRRAAGFGGNVILGVSGESTTQNTFGQITVPGMGAGPAFDSSAMGIRKTVEVIGPYSGAIVIEGSLDAGVSYDPIVTCDSGNSGVYVFSGTYQLMRVRRAGNATPLAPIVTVGGHPASAGTSTNSCFLKFGGTHYSNSESPNPYSTYYSDVIIEWSNTPWLYSMPVAGTASGLRIDVSYNDCNRNCLFHVMNGATATTQTVTVPAGNTGIFITAGAGAAFVAGDLMAIRAQTANHTLTTTITFTAMVLYTIS